MRHETIPVAQLRLDLDNYRIGHQEGQRETIQAIINDQKRDLVDTADDIVSIGLSPAESLIVIEDEEEPGFFIVLEGNRRTAALKILEWPALAADTPHYKAFLSLSKKFQERPIRDVQCVVAKDRSEARPWIERRHNRAMGGRGLKPWTPRAKDNFDLEGNTVRRSRAVLDWLKKRGALEEKTDRALDRKTSTMDRVFETGAFGDKLGVRIAADGGITFDNGDDSKGTSLLVRIVEDMARSEWTVDDVRKLQQRLDYIDSFERWAVTALRQDSGRAGASSGAEEANRGRDRTKNEGAGQQGDTGQENEGCGDTGTNDGRSAANDRKPKSRKDTLDRPTLAPTRRDLQLRIDHPRLNRIYHDAKKIKIENHPNACAFIMRSFVEMSVDEYIERKKLPAPNKLISKGKAWKDANLREKVSAVLSDLDPTGRAQVFQPVRKGLNDIDQPGSVNTLHSYLHNRRMEPSPDALKRTWEGWSDFLSALYSAL